MMFTLTMGTKHIGQLWVKFMVDQLCFGSSRLRATFIVNGGQMNGTRLSQVSNCCFNRPGDSAKEQFEIFIKGISVYDSWLSQAFIDNDFYNFYSDEGSYAYRHAIGIHASNNFHVIVKVSPYFNYYVIEI